MEPHVTLNCTPPYRYYIPNPALGYLKGFLEARKVAVKNVYWNVILAEHFLRFREGLEEYTQNSNLQHILPVVYLSKKLIRDCYDRKTPLDLFYASIYSEEEINDEVQSLKDTIDYHIKNDFRTCSLAGFTLKTHQWLMSSYIAKRLKELSPSTTIVLGGIPTKEKAIQFMHIFSEADCAIHGEGEYPLFYLIKALEESIPMKDVPNTVYKDRNRVFSTDPVRKRPSLDEYPFADHSDYFDTLNKSQFFSRNTFLDTNSDQSPVMIPVWGSRSCPWNKCRFCVLNENTRYRARSPENIVEEIEYQSRRYNVDSFIFVDTELPGNAIRFKKLLKLLMRSVANRGKKYHFVAELSPIFINDETAKCMQGVSFDEIQIGFEAMTDSLLMKMEKRQKFAHNIQALKLGTKYNLTMGGLNIIRGIPTETEEDVVESCNNVKFLRFLLNSHSLTPDLLQLDKGAPFYDDVSEKEREEWDRNPFWSEIKPISLVNESYRFEFFGFAHSIQNPLWNSFESLLKFYAGRYSYEWIEYPEGSFLEEKGLHTYRYTLNRDETDLLIFCNTIKTFSEVKERFPHISEDNLLKILEDLKGVGMLYFNEDLHEIISVVEADERKIFLYD
ncbi:MAG: radical SAM protein [Theionarchaea archaeon]|nr:radical SAM protein [Theionarchaea archaeon]